MSETIEFPGATSALQADFTSAEILYLLDLAAELKAAKRDGREEQRLVGKEIVLIFEKDSTRTRCAFEVAAYDQGAHVTFIGPSGSHIPVTRRQWKKTARVLGRMYVTRLRAGDRRRTGTVGWRAGLQRAYRRMAPDSSPGGLARLQGTCAETVERRRVLLSRGCAIQHGRHLSGGGSEVTGWTSGSAAHTPLWPRAEIVDLARSIANETGAKITMTRGTFRGRQGLRRPAQ